MGTYIWTGLLATDQNEQFIYIVFIILNFDFHINDQNIINKREKKKDA